MNAITSLLLVVLSLVIGIANASQPSKSKDPKKDNQPNEQKQETLLSDLEKSCKKMLALQIDVHKGTLTLHKIIEARSDKKPTQEDRKTANMLADDMKKIIAECDLAIAVLEKEGAAVAFPEVFKQVHTDMVTVHSRLEKCDTGKVTQDLEQGIIDTLREMTMALAKPH